MKPSKAMNLDRSGALASISFVPVEGESCLESSDRLWKHDRLSKKDGDTNRNKRDRQCKFVEVQQNVAFHRLPLVVIVTGRRGRRCQETSAKCQDL